MSIFFKLSNNCTFIAPKNRCNPCGRAYNRVLTAQPARGSTTLPGEGVWGIAGAGFAMVSRSFEVMKSAPDQAM